MSELSHKSLVFKLFSLQATTCMTATVGASLMVTVIIYNFYAENRYSTSDMYIYQYMSIYIYAVAMLLGFLLISFSSFLATTDVLTAGIWIIFIGFLVWIAMSICSYFSIVNLFEYFCIDNRCPETHWLWNTRWRDYGMRCPFVSSYSAATTEPGYVGPTPKFDVNLYKSTFLGCETYSGGLIAVSTILAVAWTLFMLYGIHVFTSFLTELKSCVA